MEWGYAPPAGSQRLKRVTTPRGRDTRLRECPESNSLSGHSLAVLTDLQGAMRQRSVTGHEALAANWDPGHIQHRHWIRVARRHPSGVASMPRASPRRSDARVSRVGQAYIPSFSTRPHQSAGSSCTATRAELLGLDAPACILYPLRARAYSFSRSAPLAPSRYADETYTLWMKNSDR
jgi:hypothetical protein